MNIYDEQLHKIEEAEENVRIAKARLLEAEKELDETLELVEAELNEEKNIHKNHILNELDTSKSFCYQISSGVNGEYLFIFEDGSTAPKVGEGIYDFASFVQDVLYERKDNALNFLNKFLNLAKKHKWTLQVWNGRRHTVYGTFNKDGNLVTNNGDTYELIKNKVIVTDRQGKKKVIKKEK